MKILLLTLVVFTGCHANLLQADNPKPQLEVLTDAIFESMGIVFKTVDDAKEKFKKTNFGHFVHERFDEGAKDAIEFLMKVDKIDPPPEVRDMMLTASKVTSETFRYLDQQLTTLIRRINSEPVSEKAAPVIEIVASELTTRAQQLREMAAPQIDKLIDKVDPLAKEVQAHLYTFYETLVKLNII
ncbi:apolipoprotein Eb-like [Xyrichtys novacula]|uniref:Apolipoprotein Eb-like n=1 Tax=Xyrichtys novacula TaxID=13765 RepID=A0AAV1FNV6_XYRNO|nr:apolipoprotein Eb-like [Xyrichtys novacula]